MPSQLFAENYLEKLSQCPYCSSGDLFFLLQASDRLGEKPGIFYLEKCRHCALVFQNPRVREENISFYYNIGPYAFLPLASKEEEKSGFWQQIQKRTLIEHFGYSTGKKNSLLYLLTFPFKRILKIKSFPDFKKQGNLLEIGCSNGDFLLQLKTLGWKVKGIEMAEASSDFGRNIRGLDIENKRIEECSFKNQEFDAIVLRMVLEHLYQPFDSLKEITAWLKKDGQLVFSIPYFNGFEFQLFKSYSYGLQLPTHITFFNKKIIKEVLENLGYQKIKFYHHFFERDIVASAEYKYQDLGKYWWKVIARNKAIRTFVIKPFVILLSLFGKTSRVTIYAQKN
ncbi:MAG: class I SAM-dependent methyltransferase [bacterium]|nr:class I SAM-dependent methyltransferase [bacterium]